MKCRDNQSRVAMILWESGSFCCFIVKIFHPQVHFMVQDTCWNFIFQPEEREEEWKKRIPPILPFKDAY